MTLADGLPRKDLGAIATAGSVEMGGGLRWTLTDLEPEQGVHVAVRRYVDLPDAAAGNLAEAAEMREPPGTLSLPPSFAIAVTGASTHDFAPSLIVTFLTAQHPMEVSVLAMQTGPRDLGAVPTPALTSALRADEALFG